MRTQFSRTNAFFPILLLLLSIPTVLQAELLYTSDGAKITITGSNPRATGDLLIPATIAGLPVTSIANSTFYGCRELTKVTIPDSVTSIGKSAFYCCIGLKSVTIPASVTSIAAGAFYYCSGLTSINIPSSVTSIGWLAFSECPALTKTYFNGHTPLIAGDIFIGSTNVTVYYIQGKTGWDTTFEGRPTAFFDPGPVLQTLHDLARNQIVLSVKAGGDSAHSVEYTDDLKQWIPLATKLVGTKDLSQLDPDASNRPFRFYRVIQQ